MLALTAGDFDFKNNMLTINKSYQRLHGEDVITPPKTEKSNRTIKMPQFLCDEMQEYLKMFYSPNNSEMCIRDSLATDAILNLVMNVADGLVVYPKVIEQHLRRELPFMATENIMMDLSLIHI